MGGYREELGRNLYRTVRRKNAEGKRRARERADQLRGAKETEGVGAERIEGNEVEVEGKVEAGAGVEEEAGREAGREGETTAGKRRGGVGAEMSVGEMWRRRSPK